MTPQSPAAGGVYGYRYLGGAAGSAPGSSTRTADAAIYATAVPLSAELVVRVTLQLLDRGVSFGEFVTSRGGR